MERKGCISLIHAKLLIDLWDIFIGMVGAWFDLSLIKVELYSVNTSLAQPLNSILGEFQNNCSVSPLEFHFNFVRVDKMLSYWQGNFVVCFHCQASCSSPAPHCIGTLNYCHLKNTFSLNWGIISSVCYLVLWSKWFMSYLTNYNGL